MAKPRWMDQFSSAKVYFQDEGEIDHLPALITVYPRENNGVKPFRYYTI